MCLILKSPGDEHLVVSPAKGLRQQRLTSSLSIPLQALHRATSKLLIGSTTCYGNLRSTIWQQLGLKRRRITRAEALRLGVSRKLAAAALPCQSLVTRCVPPRCPAWSWFSSVVPWTSSKERVCRSKWPGGLFVQSGQNSMSELWSPMRKRRSVAHKRRPRAPGSKKDPPVARAQRPPPPVQQKDPRS